MSRVTKKLLGRFGNSRAERDGTSSTGANLDEEMEKVFAMSGNDKFDLANFSGPDQKTAQRQFSEKDFDNSHRKRSYPHMHVPLKSFHSRSSRKRTPSSENEDVESLDRDQKTKDTGTEAHLAPDHGTFDPTRGAEEEMGALLCGLPKGSNDEEPVVSERAAAGSVRHSPSPDRRVQFDIDAEDEDLLTPLGGPSEHLYDETGISNHDQKLKRKHSGHHHRKPRRRPYASTDQNRIAEREDNDEEDSYCILQLEEPLQEFVQDDLTSHRFDCAKEKRRFSTKSSISSVLTNRRGTEGSIVSSMPMRMKKFIDHSPHEVFVQLDELTGAGEEREWKETARWIKYEEDVEEGADRWGKPHVASLSFHSLLNLRRSIEAGITLLDLEEKELPGIAYRVVEQFAIEQIIKEEDKPIVMRALLLRHRHVNDHDNLFRFIRRNTSSYASLQNINEEARNKPKFSVVSTDTVPFLRSSSNHDGTEKSNHTVIDMKDDATYLSSSEDLSRKNQRERESILKRIPEGAEATTVLVGTVDFLTQPATAFVRLAEAILLPAVTEVTIPVRFMFIILGPPQTDVDYHEVGRSIATLMSNSDFNKKAYKGSEKKDLLHAINEFLDFSIVIPPGNWEREALISLRELKAKNEAIRRRRSRTQEMQTAAARAPSPPGDGRREPPEDPLRRTRKPFGGLMNDVKRRYPRYLSDFIDGLNLQCLSAAIFMYFAALSAAITFGGLMAGKTGNLIGISETLIATSAAGIMFSLFSGQPLLIIGTTGPLLLFDESLYKFCKMNGIEYLTMRVYIGFWLIMIALIVACVEGSVFIKVFTRFTEEIFASLISLIYVFESTVNCISVFKKYAILPSDEYCTTNLNGTLINSTTTGNLTIGDQNSTALPKPTETKHVNEQNTALFCMILSLGTFFLAYYLKHFRNSKFLGRSARRALGDFGVPIAIVVMGTLAVFCSQIFTEKLIVPKGFSPSNPNERGWIIPLLGKHPFPFWAMIAASVPALLVYILVFMETNISELLIGKKERKLKKGCGFHLDIVLVCFANAFCGVLGAPWMCAAAVRSLTHVNSVTVMSRTHAPGEKPHIIEVKEQRVSALLVSVLTGMSMLMAGILRYVPMAVLFGVFFYMGISSIEGVQFFERLKLFFMPVKHHPQVAYVRKVQTCKMHLFTSIQLFCLILLWSVKSSSIALALPFFLTLMVPLRAQLQHVFTPEELRVLDSDEPDAIDKEDDEPDFYEESLLPG